MPVPLGPPIVVMYLPTKVTATAHEVLARGRYRTSFEGTVDVKPGDYVVIDGRGSDHGRSVFDNARMMREFRRLSP